MTDIFKVYSNFLYQGGPVVFILFLISIYLFVLIFAKFKHLFFDMELIQNEYKTNLANIKNDEYYLLNLSSLKCDFKEIVNKDFLYYSNTNSSLSCVRTARHCNWHDRGF